MEIKERSITRTGWKRVTSMATVCKNLEFPKSSGATSLMRLDEVTSPLMKTILGETYPIVDVGYYWLGVGLKDAHWWLTVMFDPSHKIMQYYFDVTLENRIDGENSSFRDLFLDVVVLPDGRTQLLDEDELLEAFTEGTISKEEKQLSEETAEMLLAAFPGEIGRLQRFCEELFSELNPKLSQQTHE